MKRRIAIVSFFVLLLCFLSASSGCRSIMQSYAEATGASEETYGITDSDDFSIHVDSNGKISYSALEVPFDMEISGKTMGFTGIEFFQIHADHGYYGYVLATLDISSFSDDDIHWMTKYRTGSGAYGKELDINMYLTNDENGAYLSTFHFVGAIYDTNSLYYLFSTDLYRYSLSGSSVNVQVINAPVSITNSDTVYYYYDFDGDPVSYGDLSKNVRSIVDNIISD